MCLLDDSCGILWIWAGYSSILYRLDLSLQMVACKYSFLNRSLSRHIRFLSKSISFCCNYISVPLLLEIISGISFDSSVSMSLTWEILVWLGKNCVIEHSFGCEIPPTRVLCSYVHGENWLLGIFASSWGLPTGENGFKFIYDCCRSIFKGVSMPVL